MLHGGSKGLTVFRKVATPYLQRRYYHIPTLRLGIRVGRLFRYTNHGLEIVSDEMFDKFKPPSILWNLTKQNYVVPTILDQQIFESTSAGIHFLTNEKKVKRHTVATIGEQGHRYFTGMLVGELDEDMLSFFDPIHGWRPANELVSCFAPRGTHLPKYEEFQYELGIDGNFQRTSLGLQELDIVTHARTLDLTKPIEGQVGLGSNVIERSHFRFLENDDYRIWRYLASTYRFSHGLDGYAEHNLVLDKKQRRLFFFATGEGKHFLRLVDGVNNPLAPFVFATMARSYVALLELQLIRHKSDLPALDIVGGGLPALSELHSYIRKTNRQLARDRWLAGALDHLGGWLPSARMVFGAQVTGSPSKELTDKPKGEEEDKGGGTGSLAAIVPYLMLVQFLIEDDSDDEGSEEDDPESLFAALDEDFRPLKQKAIVFDENLS